jgi:glycosyltransferase involved in cell wall biosynthesis
VRVLVVTDSLGLGGAENLLAVLAGAAPAADLELRVVSLTPASMGRLALQPTLDKAGLRTSFLDVHRLRDPSAVRQIARAIRSWDADVVHAHLGYSATLAPVAARLTGRGSVATLHHVPEDEPLRERVKERLALESAGRLGALVFVSDASRRAFAARYPERGSWHTVHNGVDLTRFRPEPKVPAAGLAIPATAPTVAIVAALRGPKGHDVALEAWPKVLSSVPEARLLIVGEGDRRPALEEQTRALGLQERVVFAGIRDDVPELLRAADVVALPSYTEALPTVMIEAAASGRPVVATTVGGTPEVVEDGRTGLLVREGDPEAFGEAVVRLLADPALRESMGRAARARAEALFDADRWAVRLRTIYDQQSAGLRRR